MADYAARLSEYKNKGMCGLPETIDSARVLQNKLKKLHELVVNSEHIVFLTGAGISTSAGIPDFRGPKGVWTLVEKDRLKEKKKRKQNAHQNKSEVDEENTIASANCSLTKENVQQHQGDEEELNTSKRQKGQPKFSTKDLTTPQMTSSFEKAQPTYTHRAIAQLIKSNIAHFCITQNVDGLHRRTGLERSKLAVLHGCIFTEKCEKCCQEYFRDFDVGGMSFQKTGRKCDVSTCRGDLRDTMLDWEDELPEEEFELATQHCARADLAICLGTSLRIEPAGSLPLNAKKFVIVNMQVTPKDNDAELVIRAKVDDVMSDLVRKLGVEVNGGFDSR